MLWTIHNKVITVTNSDGKVVFHTLDDCFGLDRIRDWATQNHISPENITKGGAK